MSRENVEVVERMLALLHTGDADGALQRFSPDVLADSSRLPGGGLGRGRGELSRIIGQWIAPVDDWREEVDEISAVGDRVLVIATQRGRGKGSGAEVATHYSTIYKVRDGQIVSMALYPDPDDARAATGPGERGD